MLVPGIIHASDWLQVRRQFHDVIKSGAKGGHASSVLEYLKITTRKDHTLPLGIDSKPPIILSLFAFRECDVA
jgi:hypothetical protein